MQSLKRRSELTLTAKARSSLSKFSEIILENCVQCLFSYIGL